MSAVMVDTKRRRERRRRVNLLRQIRLNGAPPAVLRRCWGAEVFCIWLPAWESDSAAVFGDWPPSAIPDVRIEANGVEIWRKTGDWFYFLEV